MTSNELLWFHCVTCYRGIGMDTTTEFAMLSSCGHVICSQCIEKQQKTGKDVLQCSQCQQSSDGVVGLGVALEKTPVEYQRLFEPASDLMSQAVEIFKYQHACLEHLAGFFQEKLVSHRQAVEQIKQQVQIIPELRRQIEHLKQENSQLRHQFGSVNNSGIMGAVTPASDSGFRPVSSRSPSILPGFGNGRPSTTQSFKSFVATSSSSFKPGNENVPPLPRPPSSPVMPGNNWSSRSVVSNNSNHISPPSSSSFQPGRPQSRVSNRITDARYNGNLVKHNQSRPSTGRQQKQESQFLAARPYSNRSRY